MSLEAIVRAHTVVARPWCCPEIALHLVTEACPLWRATERELAALGLPEPYWAFAWAGGQALARYLLDQPDEVRGRAVLSVGAGGAVEAIAAALGGASAVLASDLDPVACAAARLNAHLNGVALDVTTDDLVGTAVAHDVVLLGDLLYEEALAARLWPWLDALAARGARILVGDPGRGHLRAERVRRVWAGPVPSDVDVGGRWLREGGVYAVVASGA